MPADNITIAYLAMTDGRFLRLDVSHSKHMGGFVLSAVPFTVDPDGNESCDLFRDMTNSMTPIEAAPRFNAKRLAQVAAMVHADLMHADGWTNAGVAAKIDAKGGAGLSALSAPFALRNPTTGAWSMWRACVGTDARSKLDAIRMARALAAA